MSLYAIQSEMTDIIDAILEGGIDTPEAQAALDEHLAGLDAALDSKADNYAALIQELGIRAEARRNEARRMRELADADAALADRLKVALRDAMQVTGRLRIDTPRFRLSVAQNGGVRPLVVTCDPTSLPKELQKVTVDADRAAIRAALEAGATVDGCSLEERGTSLRIK